MTTPNLKGICVLVDGGCRNNQKPVSERSMYGSLTVLRDGEQVESMVDLRPSMAVHKFDINPVCDHASNNVAEVVMVRFALKYVFDLVQRTKQQGKAAPQSITIMSDSEWAIGAVTGAYKLKPQNELVLHNQLEDIKWYRKSLANETTVTFQHVDNAWVKGVLGH